MRTKRWIFKIMNYKILISLVYILYAGMEFHFQLVDEGLTTTIFVLCTRKKTNFGQVIEFLFIYLIIILYCRVLYA